ncbi:organic cation transporter protein-like [Macrobrachium rosenbergii]|uniref:organic cation transporter protein-like n=1 Tax=Macrobrachium rosenbergii TaxID=79674 RepID=UPI0034D6A46C
MAVEAFDDLLKVIGTGKWNILTFVAVAYWFQVIVYHALAVAFLAPAVKHTCVIPPEDQLTLTSQVSGDNATETDQCYYTSGNISRQCKEWHYDNTIFGHTMTSEFDLVCSRAYLRSIYQSIYMFGSLIAAPIGGILADKYGRKFLFTIGSTTYFVLSLIACWIPTMPTILAFRFLMGLMHTPTMNAAFILGMEICAPAARSTVGVLFALPWAFGTVIWGGLAYFIRDWRWLQFAVSLPTVILFPALWYIDESPRWLVVRGQDARAIEILQKAARWNGISPIPEEDMKELTRVTQSKVTSVTEEGQSGDKTRLQMVWEKVKNCARQLFILFKTRRLRRTTLVVWMTFMFSSTVFFGLTLNATNFSVDPYFYMIFNGLVEIPAYIFPAPITARFGRKFPIIIGFSITSVCLLALPFIDKDESTLVVTIIMVGRLLLSSAFQLFFLYSAEQFPTEVRLQGFGSGIFLSRLGGIFAPFITELLGPLYSWSPSVVFGVFSLITSSILLLVPETLNKPMPETIAEFENDSPTATNNKKHDLEMEKSRHPDGDTQEMEQKEYI